VTQSGRNGAQRQNIVPCLTLEEFVHSLARPANDDNGESGAPVDAVIAQLLPLLKKAIALSMAATRFHTDTIRREANSKKKAFSLSGRAFGRR
jgi:6-phosphogluconate dehydrogenase